MPPSPARAAPGAAPVKMRVLMPRAHVDHPILRRVRELTDEEKLHDTTLHFESCTSSSTMLRANSVVLSLCSPVLHKMLYGSFIEINEKKITLKDVDGNAFVKAFDMWCGKLNNVEMALDEVKELASVVDRFQMTDVASALDMTVTSLLSVGLCSDVLNWSGELGLHQSEQVARKLAMERFDELTNTEGFMQMGEEVLGRLLEDDDLAARDEEAVWEALAVWRAGEGQARGRGLVGKIRFPLMEEGYLRSRVVGMAPAEEAEWMKGVVAEALRAKAARRDGGGFEFELLGPKALARRVGLGVKWWEYADGGERLLLSGHIHDIGAVAKCEGWVCSGSRFGTIHVFGMRGEVERTLLPEGTRMGNAVHSLSAWEGRLISGHDSGELRVWNVATGTCDQVLKGHEDAVFALALCGSRLASGSSDSSIRVWAMETAGGRICERTLLGHKDKVLSLAFWQGKVMSGSGDRSIRVWDAGMGAHVATLAGHTRSVVGLAVYKARLISASSDGTIRVWALGTWAALQTVEAYGRWSAQRLRCLAVSGSQLVSGSGGMQAEVRVWDLETLDLKHTLLQPSYVKICALLAVEGSVWAGVGSNLVVWGLGS